ncbi:MAG: methionyl-tRNA formyltransferase [Betaproteobacteria bacterium]
MRVGFAGTPAFAALALEALIAGGFAVPLVLTQPDRPKGRGLNAESSPVKRIAVGRGLRVFQPATLKSAEARAALVAVPLDVLVVAAYGLILTPAVLAWPRFGCINIHASKLPRWRGAAPIQRAIAAGDTRTGVTIMQMDAGLDTGPMIECVDVDIAPRETAGSLHDKLAAVGARAIIAVLIRLARDGAIEATPQPATGATYANKIERADAAIDWGQSAAVIDRQVRAFDPVPGAATQFNGQGVKVWRAEPVLPESDASAGIVLASGNAGIDVACGDGALRLIAVQPANGKRMSAAAFAAGHGVADGVRFGHAAAT